MRKNLLILAVSLVFPALATAQSVDLRQPTPEEYDDACSAYTTESAEAMELCRERLREQHGLYSCQDREWSSYCRTDEMTDRRSCTASAKGSHLFVFAIKGQMAFSVAGGENYPGEALSIRIDTNPVVRFVEHTSPAQDQLIERQIRKGTLIRTRYARWPSGISDDSSAPVCNLATVMDEMKAETR